MARAKTKAPVPKGGKGELVPLGESTPTTILERAVISGASIEVLERLMALQERFEANQARKAFDAAMATIRNELPAIVKDQTVDYTSARGHTNYRYESLHAVTEALSPVMAKHGLSFRWRTNTEAPDSVAVTCILSHCGGHSEEVTLVAKHDHSGSKNDIQALGSAVTYLQCYTLKAALGVAAAADDDGNGVGRHDKEELPKQPPAKPTQSKSATTEERDGGAPEPQQEQTVPRGHKYERTAAHNHLEEVIEGYCKANNISPDKEGLTILERMSAYETREGRKHPGVRDVLLLSEKEAIICRRTIQDTIDRNRNWRVDLGQAIIKYCQGKKVAKEEVLKACSGKTTIRDLSQEQAKAAFSEFEKRYPLKK